jgi:hypothetical protein
MDSCVFGACPRSKTNITFTVHGFFSPLLPVLAHALEIIEDPAELRRQRSILPRFLLKET